MLTQHHTSLRDALTALGPAHLGSFIDQHAQVAYADVLAGSCFADGGSGAKEHTALLAADSQLASALALIDLDGIAREIVLCPPDLSDAHRSVIARRLAVDVFVSDSAGGIAHTALQQPIAQMRCAPETVGPPAKSADRVLTDWILLTSGTFGPPKTVRHTLATLTGAIGAPAAQPGDIVWSTFYDIRRFGGLQIFLRALLGGHTLVLSNAHEAPLDFLQRAGANGVTHITGTPSHWRNALMTGAIETISPRYVRLSGEIATQAILDALANAFPKATLVHAYASTEAGVGFEVTDGREGFPSSLIGDDADGLAMRVVDGSLRIRSPRAASGYTGDDSSQLKDADGFIDSGDMVELRGGRYYFTGRRGGIINVGGAKVHPEEVEEVINRHPRVRLSLVRARPNPLMGAIVVADVVLNGAPEAARQPSDADTIRSEITALCQATLAAHKVPMILRFVPDLPTTPTGKLVRGAK